jgi:hypothetical protein
MPAEPKFIPDRFADDPGHELLIAAARLTLRLAVHDRNAKFGDPNSIFSLLERIKVLMAAYVNSEDGEADANDGGPALMLLEFANAVSMIIGEVPSLQAAVTACLAAYQPLVVV